MWNNLREEIFAIFLNFGQIRLSLTRKKYFCKNPRKFIPREMNFKDQLDEKQNTFAWIWLKFIKFYHTK